jgi:hypothetical protein
VVASFAKYSGRTIVMNGEIGNPAVTAVVRDVEWEVGLNRILAAQGLIATTGSTDIIKIDRRPLITAQFVDASLREVVAAVARHSGLTIVVNGSVADARVNATVRDADWRGVLDTVLPPLGLTAVLHPEGIVRIGQVAK